MKTLKKILLGIVIVIALAAILAVVTGNSHLFKAVFSTYLKGHSGPLIDEYAIFESRTVTTGKYQPWEMGEYYNKVYDKDLLKEIETFDPAAFLVVKHGKIVYEKYWNGYDENSLTNSFSVAKTFIGLLIGIAIDEGKINSIDDLATVGIAYALMAKAHA